MKNRVFFWAFLVPGLFYCLAAGPGAAGAGEAERAAELNRQAVSLYKKGQYDQAAALAEKVLAMRRKIFGPEHPEVVQSLNNLAGIYHVSGDLARAEPLYRQAVALAEKIFGPDDVNVSDPLNNLGALLKAKGEFYQAETVYLRALASREKSLGPEHVHVAYSLNNLAGLYLTLKDYPRAEDMYLKALAIWEKVYGPDCPEAATTSNNLALLHHGRGDFSRAERLYQKSLTVRQKVLGPDHPLVAISLNNLAGLYADLGDDQRAEPLYQQALALQQKSLGPEHPDVAVTLNNLGLLYKARGDFVTAGSFYQRALAVDEKVLGPNHPEVALDLNNLAMLYKSLRDFPRAEKLGRRALAVREKSLGPGHPEVATSLNNLAILRQNQGDYSGAEALYRRALTVLTKSLGPDHPLTVDSKYNLSGLLAARGQYQKALALQLEAQAATGKLIDSVMGFTSGGQKILYLTKQKKNIEALFSLVAFHLSDSNRAVRECLDIWLGRKGIVLEAESRFQEALVYSDNPRAAELFLELSRVRSQISGLVFAPPGQMAPKALGELRSDLERKKDELESELSRLSQPFFEDQKMKRADSKQVAAILPPGSVLIELSRFKAFDFKSAKWQDDHYLAFMIPAQNPEGLALIRLGSAEPIDRAISAFKEAVMDTGDLKGQASLAWSQKLYELVFAKFRPILGRSVQIFMAPDGNLNLIPFEIMTGPDGRYLIEDFSFNYLTSGRDLLNSGQRPAESGPPLLLGDPDYNLDKSFSSGPQDQLSPQKEEPRSFQRSRDMQNMFFAPIPATRDEVMEIAGLLSKMKPNLYTGEKAGESALFQARAPRILHLATHGFFLRDQDGPVINEPRSLGAEKVDAAFAPRMDNPLLRSGLALAGANLAMTGEDRNQSGGLFTAEKVLGLNLFGTELVVLSACETGLGEVRAGEGVYGLRRAFTQVGARSLVMSMWSVPDQETRELMLSFYRNILAGLPKGAALRQAALAEMALARKRYQSINPLFWGAFIYQGRP